MIAAAGRPNRRGEVVDQQPGRVGVVEVEVAEGQPAVLGHGRPPGPGARPHAGAAGGPVQRRPLVRVLAVAERQRLAPVGEVDRGGQLGAPVAAGVGRIARVVEPGGHRGVVRRGQREGGAGQPAPRGVADPALCPQLLEHDRVVGGVGEHGHRGMVLGGRPDHGRPADVDDVLGARAAVGEVGDVDAERVDVDHHEVERLDALGGHVGLVGGVGGIGEDAAVHLGVQRHDPVPEDRVEPRQLGQVGHVQPGVAQRGGGAARRHQVDAELGQLAGELDDAGLVVDRQQGPHVSAPPSAWRAWIGESATSLARTQDESAHLAVR